MIGLISRHSRLGRAALGAVPCVLIAAFAAGCQESAANASASAATTAVAPKCGSEGVPECPTQLWMKATLQAYLRTRNFSRLEAAFKTLAEGAPKGYDAWQRIAEDGASAAKVKDEGRIRASCQECHDRHRSRFREELRAVEIL